MSLQENLNNFVTRITTEFKKVYGFIGSTVNLATADKTSVVNAINEVNAKSGNLINDNAANSTTTAFSANKTTQLIAAAKSEIIGGADNLHDTLKEISDLADSAAGSMTTAIGNRLRFDQAQSLTAGQKAQVATNGGLVLSSDIGDVNTDFVALFNAGLV